MKYLARKSRNRGRAKSARPRGIVGYRPRFLHRWTSELDIRAAVKGGGRKATR